MATCDSNSTNMAEPQIQIRAVSRFRELLPQVLASASCTLLMIDLSVSIYFSTVVIGQLRNSTGPLALDDEKASWIGSIPFICQPIGSLTSGLLMDLLGRKRVMILMNLPFLLGWILMSTATSFTVLCLASVVVGLTLGLIEAPLSTYIGEVCQPAIRGVMSSSTSVMFQVGTLLVLLAGTLLRWRTTAAVCTSIPIITAFSMVLIPEAPIWLISRGRIKDAERALCWLRGWVDPSVVQQELEKLIQYHDTAENKPRKEENSSTSLHATCRQYGTQAYTYNNEAFFTIHNSAEQSAFVNPSFVDDSNGESQDTNNCTADRTGAIGCKKGVLAKVEELGQATTLRPLLLIVPCMFFVTWSGHVAVRPFMVQVFEEFQMPVGPEWGTVINALAGVLGAVVLVLIVHRVGKRPLALFGSAITVVSTLLLGLYAYIEMEEARRVGRGLWASWVPLLLFATMSFMNSFLGMLPWALICEVFPFRTRGMSAGICSASYYLFAFLASKTFLDIQRNLQLHGAFWLYTAVNVICFVYLYLRLPETEGKSLEDIERYFTLGLNPRTMRER